MGNLNSVPEGFVQLTTLFNNNLQQPIFVEVKENEILQKNGTEILYKATMILEANKQVACCAKILPQDHQQVQVLKQVLQAYQAKFKQYPDWAHMIHGLIEDGSTCFVIMDVPKTLQCCLYENEFPFDREVVAKECLEVVTQMHNFGILHKDISSTSFVIDEQGTVKLKDFGSNPYQDAVIDDGMVERHGGNMSYMAPERFSSQRSILRTEEWILSDLYNVGMVMCEVLSGTKPHGDLSDKEIFERRKQNPAKCPYDETTCFNTMYKVCVRTLLVADPAERKAAPLLQSSLLSDYLFKFGVVELYHNKNVVQGIELLVQAVEKKNIYALQLLSQLYQLGKFVAKDEGKHLEYQQRISNIASGSEWIVQWMQDECAAFEEVQVTLAIALQKGWGSMQDYSKAVAILRKFDKHPQAQSLLGYYYQHGLGVEPNSAAAFEWYNAAASQGHAEAQYFLGMCYNSGIGVDTNFAKAFDQFALSAKQANPQGTYQLGLCYLNAHGTYKDVLKAVECFAHAAHQNLPEAQNDLGECIEQGIGVSSDPNTAIEWYQKSARQGYVVARFNLANCYRTGYGTSKDIPQAILLYQSASDQGHAKSRTLMAIYNLDGVHVVKNEPKAAHLFALAAEQGDAQAQTHLGWLYQMGHVVKQDLKQASYWYMKAADQNYAFAQNLLGCCYQKGLGVEKDPEQAFQWYQKSAQQGHVDAQCNIGMCYHFGIGTAPNTDSAKQWYETAIAQGSTVAQSYLYKLEHPESDTNVQEAIPSFKSLSSE